MDYMVLYIFVEGDDDERFFREILLPILKKKYDDVKIVKYAQKPKKFEYIEKFIKSIVSMKGDYMYVTDIDHYPCVTAKKQEIQNNLKNIDVNKVLVVIKEIESWYISGLNNSSVKKLGIKQILKTTENVTKEQFDSLIPQKFHSRLDFMREVLKNFSVEIAKQKNKSFMYFIEKYNC